MDRGDPPAVALDLDGVLWRGARPIVGSAAAVAEIRAAGHDLAFVSNNSTAPPIDVVRRLAQMGVPADPAEVLTSAQAAARRLRDLLAGGAAVLVVGGAGITEALSQAGLVPCSPNSGRRIAGVVVGLDTGFDYARLDAALQAIRGGAVFVATNTDPTLPVEDGVRPGAGAMVSAISTASGVEPEVAGKPHRPIADLVRASLGERGVVVGDRPDTDGGLAGELGWQFALVLSGVTPNVGAHRADYVAADLAALVPAILAMDT